MHSKRVQPNKACRELTNTYSRTTRCPRVTQTDSCCDIKLTCLRFSKLFMSHLDAEFRKQAAPSLKSLVADQVHSSTCIFFDYPNSSKFEGKQVYGTVCDRCSYRSERPSTFLEIEINLEVCQNIEPLVGYSQVNRQTQVLGSALRRY